MKKIIILLIFICLSISSCTYDFSSDNFIEISKPETIQNNIDLSNFKNLDTINVSSQLNYTFKGLPNQILIESKLYIDNKSYQMTMDGNQGIFFINPSTLEDGIHIIKIENKFTSGTGSIADQIQKEILSSTQEYKFIVHRNPSTPPGITEAIIKDGSIYVKWGAINNPEYKKAFLSIKFKNKEIKIPLSRAVLESGFYNDTKTVLYEGSFNQPDFDSYSKVTYAIVFESPYVGLNGTNKSIDYDKSWFTVKIALINSDSYKIIWSAHPLYANFNEIEFRSGYTTFMGSNKGGEYIVNSPYIIGYEYDITTQITDLDNNYLPYYTFRNVGIEGNSVMNFDFHSYFSKEILYNPSTNHYYSLILERNSTGYFKIFIYEFSEKLIFLSKKFIADYNSPRHERLKFSLDPSSHNFYVDADHGSYTIEKSNLSIIKQYIGQPFSASSILRNDKLVITDGNNIKLSNITSNIPIFSGIASSCYLSRDGKYLYIKNQTYNTVFKIENNQLTKLVDINYNSWRNNIDIEDDILYYMNNNQINIVDLKSKISKSFTVGSYDNMYFDVISQKILFAQNNRFAIYDLSTSTISLFSSEINKQAIGEFYQEDTEYFLRIRNKKLLHSKGFATDLN
ncbi:hypothetical protein [Flavobacterium sp. TSSA_36]|uniref:hypothetical protein n=1 Tax=Flavobacterium sp. TSSA_36 TaxID=3447669 RepID=UPI003F303B55